MTVLRASVAVAAVSRASVIAGMERASFTVWPVRVANLFLINGCVECVCASCMISLVSVDGTSYRSCSTPLH